MAHRTPHRKSKVRPFVLGFQHLWAGVRWDDWLNSHECPMMPHDVACIFWPRWKHVSSLLVCTKEDISVNICHLSFNKPESDFESPVAFWAVLYELGLPWERVLGHGPNRIPKQTVSTSQTSESKLVQRTWSALLLKHTKAWKGSSFVIPLPPYAPRR